AATAQHAAALSRWDLQLDSHSKWRYASAPCSLVGLVGLAMWLRHWQQHTIASMHAYLFAFVTCLCVALGCLVFVLLQHLSRAGWSVVVRRIAESTAAALPLFMLLIAPILLWQDKLFVWQHMPHDPLVQAKAAYLNAPFFVLRSLLYVLLFAGMGLWLHAASTRQDSGTHAKTSLRMRAASPAMLLLFGLAVTFASFDWIMSLQPHWYSTIFGVLIFTGCVISGLSLLILLCVALQASGYLPCIRAAHYYDLGKLLFGFTVFWAYIAFSQFMLQWYAAIPEEVVFYSHRLHGNWAAVSWAMPITHFFIPFFLLLSRWAKCHRVMLSVAALWTLAMHAVHIAWLVLPALAEHAHVAHAHTGDSYVLQSALPLASAQQLTAASLWALLGIGSLLLAAILFVLARKPLVPAGDPMLHESLQP
ncbi:MAG: hypothetical protein AAF310_06470, partial [Myxococcota bacterium]